MKPNGADKVSLDEQTSVRFPLRGVLPIVFKAMADAFAVSASSSGIYKLALLRLLSRIADEKTCYARVVEDAPNQVELPLGPVALFWLRQYMTLLKAGLPQQPNKRELNGLGFVKEAFRCLVAPPCNTSALDLRVGVRLKGARA